MTLNLTKKQIEKIAKKTSGDDLEDISSLVLFMGHAHSGHSIIGAILDAHPAVAMSNEANIAKLIRDHRLNKREIESILLHHSQAGNRGKNWHNSEYKHEVPNSYQGKTLKPLIIGDKKAGGTARILYHDFWVLTHLHSIYKNKLKVIFVERNPLDIVAAYSYYMKEKPRQFHVDRYLENLEVVKKTKDFLGKECFLSVNQYEFINDPAKITNQIFNFLDIHDNLDHIASWVSHVKNNIKGKSQLINIPENLRAQLPKVKGN